MPGPRPSGAGCAAIGDVATSAAKAIADKVAVVAELKEVICHSSDELSPWTN
jgi:hypothetical protein